MEENEKATQRLKTLALARDATALKVSETGMTALLNGIFTGKPRLHESPELSSNGALIDLLLRARVNARKDLFSAPLSEEILLALLHQMALVCAITGLVNKDVALSADLALLIVFADRDQNKPILSNGDLINALVKWRLFYQMSASLDHLILKGEDVNEADQNEFERAQRKEAH